MGLSLSFTPGMKGVAELACDLAKCQETAILIKMREVESQQ